MNWGDAIYWGSVVALLILLFWALNRMDRVATKGQLIAAARKAGVEPHKDGTGGYYTLVIDWDKREVFLTTPTDEDMRRARAASPRNVHSE